MMRTTFRLFAAACLFTATLGCQPETTEPDVSTDMNIDMGEADTGAPMEGSNTTATGELPQSNVTGEAEVPETTETPAVSEVPADEVPESLEGAEPAQEQDPAADSPESLDLPN